MCQNELTYIILAPGSICIAPTDESVTDFQKPLVKWPLSQAGGTIIPPLRARERGYASAAGLLPYDPQNLQKSLKNEAKWEAGGSILPPYDL